MADRAQGSVTERKGKIAQKHNSNSVMGYTFNLCENYISIVILNQNIKNQ